MSWEFDNEDLPETMDGYDIVAEGSYHFLVEHLDENGGNNGEMVVDAKVQEGTDKSQIGKIHREYFSKPKADQDREKRAATVKRVVQFAIACGLMTEEEYEATVKAKRKLVLDYRLAVGRHFTGKLKKSEYQGKTKTKLGYDMWPIDSPKAAGIPINRGTLAKQGDAAADPFDGVF